MSGKTGWLLDLFETPAGDICMWFIGADGIRFRVRQRFPVTFFVSGEKKDLAAVARRVKYTAFQTELEYTERYDLFERKKLPVMAIKAQSAYDQPIYSETSYLNSRN